LLHITFLFLVLNELSNFLYELLFQTHWKPGPEHTTAVVGTGLNCRESSLLHPDSDLICEKASKLLLYWEGSPKT